MKLYWRKRRISFCFRYQKYINIFVNYMCRDLNLFRRGFMLRLCKDQPIDVSTTHIFQSFTGFRESSSVKIWWSFMWLFKNLILPYRFIATVTERIWLNYLMMNVMLRYWVTSLQTPRVSHVVSTWNTCGVFVGVNPKTAELFSLPKVILPLVSTLYQSCFNKNSQAFLVNSVVPDLLKWTLLSFKCLSM